MTETQPTNGVLVGVSPNFDTRQSQASVVQAAAAAGRHLPGAGGEDLHRQCLGFTRPLSG